MIAARSEDYSPPRSSFSSFIGFLFAWTLASFFAVQMDALEGRSGVLDWAGHAFGIAGHPALLAILSSLVFGLLLAVFQWWVLQAFLKDSHFGWKIPVPGNPPNFYLWIGATTGGYLLRGILIALLTAKATVFFPTLFRNLFLFGFSAPVLRSFQNFLTLLVFAGLARLAVSICQWLALRRWFGRRAALWPAAELLAHVLLSAIYAGLLPGVADWLVNGLITGLGLVWILAGQTKAKDYPLIPANAR